MTAGLSRWSALKAPLPDVGFLSAFSSSNFLPAHGGLTLWLYVKDGSPPEEFLSPMCAFFSPYRKGLSYVWQAQKYQGGIRITASQILCDMTLPFLSPTGTDPNCVLTPLPCSDLQEALIEQMSSLPSH